MTSHVIHARNVNDAFSNAVWWLRVAGLRESSRNGDVLVSPGPVITEYSNPCERILWEHRRDANPTFHLMEAIWMLAGQNDVTWLLPFNARFAEYAEAGKMMHGAYGHRWREFFGHDQIHAAIKELEANPASRRVVLGMWHPTADQGTDAKDIPCNTHIYFDCRGDRLNMTVCCRSNDILWGAYGANVVHMSMLQELIAFGVGVPVGVYRQMSNNFHAYTSVPQMADFLANPPSGAQDEYKMGTVDPTPLLTGNHESVGNFLLDCETMVGCDPRSPQRAPVSLFYTEFFRKVAAPMFNQYCARKYQEVTVDTDDMLERFPPRSDWGLAFYQWLERRAK